MDDFQLLSYQKTLEDAGCPTSLAQQGAKILVKDDPNVPNLGRTKEELEIARSVCIWLNAKGFTNS